jgi:hypothetical protein
MSIKSRLAALEKTQERNAPGEKVIGVLDNIEGDGLVHVRWSDEAMTLEEFERKYPDPESRFLIVITEGKGGEEE